MRRLAFAMLGLGLFACGVAYAPGDFLGGAAQGAPSEAGPTTEADAGAEGGAAEVDSGPGGIHVMLLGGHRDPIKGETGDTSVSEVLIARLSPLGELGPWAFEQAPPDPQSWTRAIIANGHVYAHNASTLVEASFVDHVTSPWTSTPMKAIPAAGVRAWLLDEHGFFSGANDNGTAQWTDPFLADAGIGSWVQSSSVVAVPRGDVTLVRLDGFVYALGGHAGEAFANGVDNVEIASFDAGAMGNLIEVTPLTAGDAGSVGNAGAAYPTTFPVVATGSGRVVVAGGLDGSGTLTNVVLAARVNNPTTGALDPWVTLPPLPEPMNDFAMVVTVNYVLVLGGQTATAASSNVLAIQVGSDGSYSDAWKVIGQLPGARSGLAAVTF